MSILSSASPFIPNISDLGALAAVLVVAAAFVGLGLAAGARAASGDALLMSGWGGFVLIATLFGVASPQPLVWALYPLLGLGLVLLVWGLHGRGGEASVSGRLLLIGLPLLAVVAAASASQWDEFAHWLVNQKYLVENGTFPRRGLPESTTIFAAYPYGLPLVGFVASRLGGHFVENAGALFNTLLIVVLGRAVIRAFCAGAGRSDADVGWVGAALGVMAATVLNPTFVPKLVFTTYADWSTAVVVGVVVLTGGRLLEQAEPLTGRLDKAAGLQMGLALAVLVSLKQPNVLLAFLLLLGFALAALTGAAPLRMLIRIAPRVIGPPLIAYAAWRYHVLQHLPGREFSFMPLAEWLWADLGAILARMALIASKKGGYFGLMIVATGIATHAAGRALAGRPVSALGRLAIFVGVPFLGYNAFLYLAYVGSFGAGEGQNAASYWRYNTQLGGAALIFAATSAGVLHHRYASHLAIPKHVGTAVILVVLAAPVLLAPKIRFDLNPVTRYVRSIGSELAQRLSVGTRLAVFDPADNGKRALLLRYETARVAQVQRLAPNDPNSLDALRQSFAALQDAYLWVHVPTPTVAAALGVELAPGASYLLQFGGRGWTMTGSWPYPGYADPVIEDD